MDKSFQALKDLNLSHDEVNRIGSALKDKEFRKLLVDYVEELRDPENKKLFEKEITELERERGVDVTFINPVAGYVIKTSVNGTKKAFINICSNEHIKKPTSTPQILEGSKGLQWSLPHSLSPPRDDADKKGVRCQVFDVVFHADTLHLATNNKAFRNMVNNTACEAIESNFDVKLDTKNLKFPKLQYKGMPHSSVIRKPSIEKLPEKTPEEQAYFDKIYESMPKPQSPKKVKKHSRNEDFDDFKSKYTTPKYVMKHRSHIELEEFRYERSAKMNTAIPKELVIEIQLPLLKSAGDIVLDVTEKSVQLKSENPSKYKLSLTLPYQVNQDNGNAKFDKDLKRLIITLPVKRDSIFVLTDFSRDDSGVESDHGFNSSPTNSSPPNDLIQELKDEGSKSFLDINEQYSLPEYTCHVCENIIAFTLHVKNVNENTIEKLFNDVSTSIHVKFTSISSGFFPVNYSFYVKLPNHFIDVDNVSIEAWDNNVVVQLAFNPCDKIISSYLVGTNEHNIIKKMIEEPSLINNLLKDHNDSDDSNDELIKKVEIQKQEIQEWETQKHEKQKANIVLDTVALKEEPRSGAIDIFGSCSESSGDELSMSYSPSASKGILKRISSSRSSVSRSISESSIDDLRCASSFEYYNSMDSVIPEDGELSTSLKKTVRFNDNVTRQLFRSNSSILGQKKKNQRKKNAKKRAQERRYSESELSESDDKRGEERDQQTDILNELISYNKIGEKHDANNIFEFDM